MKKHGRGDREGAVDQARDMVATFASVGARRFDLTLTDAAGGKVGFRPDCPIDRLRPALETTLRDAAARQHGQLQAAAFTCEDWIALTQCGPPQLMSSLKEWTRCAQTVQATQRVAP